MHEGRSGDAASEGEEERARRSNLCVSAWLMHTICVIPTNAAIAKRKILNAKFATTLQFLHINICSADICEGHAAIYGNCITDDIVTRVRC